MLRTTEMLVERQLQQNTLLCCGLDPDFNKLPPKVLKLDSSWESKVIYFLTEVVRVTAQHVCAYKAQKAFFDHHPHGHQVLQEIIAFIHNNYPNIPVIVDCKVGDIDNTMTIYMRSILDILGADGMVVNPYMGDEVLKPFVTRPGKMAVVLVKTSNPGSSVMQDVILQNGEPYWKHTLDLVVNRWNVSNNMSLVISSTAELDMASVRKLIPNAMPILLAGIGAQGGNLNNLHNLLNSEGVGVYINSSRNILYNYQYTDQSWQAVIERAALNLKDKLNQNR